MTLLLRYPEAEGGAKSAARAVVGDIAVAVDIHEGDRVATIRRRKPPVGADAIRTLHAVHAVRENRVLDIPAAEPARRSHQPCTRDFVFVGEPQLTGIDPCAAVIIGQDAGIAETGLRPNALLDDDRLEVIREVEIDAAGRVIHVGHLKRIRGTVRDLARQRIDEQIAVGRKPRHPLIAGRSIVEVDKVHLESIWPNLNRAEVDVIADFRIAEALVGVDAKDLRPECVAVGRGERNVVPDVDLREIGRRNSGLDPRPRACVSIDFVRVFYGQVNSIIRVAELWLAVYVAL